jgi:hypothetical protein
MHPGEERSLRFARLLPYTVNKVIEGHYGMPIYHPGAGISHHGADLITHHGFVTMDQAPGTRRLPPLIRAPRETFPGICQELITTLAETFPSLVPGAAMHSNHRLNGLILSCYAGMLGRHCRLFDQITP